MKVLALNQKIALKDEWFRATETQNYLVIREFSERCTFPIIV